MQVWNQKIPTALPQFTQTHALIVVTGMHAGALYHAHDGEIEKLEAFAVPIPRYSDKEGFYARGGKGGTYVSGAVREIDKQEVVKPFLKELNKQIAALLSPYSISEVYLFSPPEIKSEIRAHIPKLLDGFIRGHILGNHIHDSPIELLQKIQKEHGDAAEGLKESVASEEVKKLLSKKG